MTKNEFLDNLRKSLSGDVSPELIEENIQYYDEYISIAVRNGETEEEVIAKLPEPSLLAKTIKNASNESGESEEDTSSKPEGAYSKYRVFRRPLLLILIIILVVIVLFIIGGFFLSLVAYLLPFFIVPIILIALIVAVFRSR